MVVLACLFVPKTIKFEQKMSFKSATFVYAFILIVQNIINFYPLEVVGRDSEPQLHVGENSNSTI